MIHRVIDEFERRSVQLSPAEEGEIQHLLLEYEPVLRFHRGERFFPMSALLYLLFSTIWYIPLKSREGEDIVDSPHEKRSKPRLFELLRSRPHIQLNTEVDHDLFEKAPAANGYVRLQHIQQQFARPRTPATYPVDQLRRILESRIRRFRSAWLNPGMLFLHFSEAIPPWDRRLLRHWFLPRGCDDRAKSKYDDLTLSDGGRQTCYYGRVVDQCGYRIVQYWFFYAFNDFRTAVRGANNHEGDWESIAVYLRQENGRWQPNYAAYSSHQTRQAVAWGAIECADEARQHPIVYVGRGSHACYFEPGVYRPGVGPLRVRDYALGDGEEIGPGKWTTPRILTETSPDWLFFDGFWGAYIRDLLMRENAPRGPVYTLEPAFHRPVRRQSWDSPRDWADLSCQREADCRHGLRGYYGDALVETAWQEDWGSDQEWAEWAKTTGLGME